MVKHYTHIASILIKARGDGWKGDKKIQQNPLQFLKIIKGILDFLNLHFVSNNCEFTLIKGIILSH